MNRIDVVAAADARLLQQFLVGDAPESVAPNQPPMAAFSFVADGLSVEFTDESTDADGTVVAWLWDFGDESDPEYETDQHPTHEYAEDGEYTVRLTVTDDDGATVFVEQQVEVSIGALTPPTGFDWAPPFSVFDNAGAYSTDLDWDSLAPDGGRRYVNGTTGDNGNDGLTPETAWLTIRKAQEEAIADTGINRVYVATGDYRRSNSWLSASGTPTQDMAWIATGGRVTTSRAEQHSLLSWSAVGGGAPNTWQVTRSAVNLVVDRLNPASTGEPAILVQRASLAEVDANPGSWWQSGSTLYVRTIDDREPDADIMVLLNETHVSLDTSANGSTWYWQGFDFWGGATSNVVVNVGADTGARVVFDDCHFAFSAGNGGLDIDDVDETFLRNCTVTRAFRDGFNYHATDLGQIKILEENCTSVDNGRAGDDVNNGSSAHEDARVIRVGGVYRRNDGPNVIDINTSQTWCVGTVAGDSAADAGTGQSNFRVSNTAKMWLHRCTSETPGTFDRVVAGTAEMFAFEGTYAIGSDSGTVQGYTP